MDDSFRKIFDLLVAHAGAEPEDEFKPASPQCTFAGLSDALNAAKAQLRKEEIDEAARAAIELEQLARADIKENVSKIRSSRKQQAYVEAELKKQISKVELALFYAGETSNFLPLIAVFNPKFPLSDEAAVKDPNFLEVPEDYVNKFNILKEKEKKEKASKKSKK